jgi:hypothetical protein
MSLEERVDALAKGWGTEKKKLFSGFGYMINGNLAFGTHKKDQLIVRAGEQKSIEILKRPGVKVFDLSGRPR